MTPATETLRALAAHVIAPYTALPAARAAMVTGSVAKGLADNYSDLDLAVYYEATLPSEETLAAIRAELGGSERKWVTDGRESGGFAEAYTLQGVEVQLIHATIEGWEATMAELQAQLQVDTPLPKALEGMLNCRPLFGADVIARWKRQAADYPDALAEAMVKRYLAFFPAWGLQPYFETRDATVWYYQIMVEAAHNLLGLLAGLNRVYFTPFQFKRAARFAAELPLAPPDFAKRLDTLFTLPPADALPALEQLVDETLTLVETHMPHIDTTPGRRRIGWRATPWDADNLALTS